MNQIIHSFRRLNLRRRHIWILATLLATTLLFMGCAGQYGRLHVDAELTRMFTTNRVPETYRYYFDGRPQSPYAIIGLAPGYELSGGFWEPVTPNSADFARKVDFIWIAEERNAHAKGALMVSPKGETLGIWYSQYPFTTIRVYEDNRVEVHSPYLLDPVDRVK